MKKKNRIGWLAAGFPGFIYSCVGGDGVLWVPEQRCAEDGIERVQKQTRTYLAKIIQRRKDSVLNKRRWNSQQPIQNLTRKGSQNLA